MAESAPPAAETVRGFARDARQPGTRNSVVVLPSVICSGVVAESIAAAVPEAVCLPHDHGCGQIGGDKDQTRRTLLNVSRNPNVAGVVVVGLGCETLDSEALAADLDLPVRQTAIQTAGGTDEAIETGTQAARELIANARSGRRTETGLDELTLGITVSDLSDSTVEAATPLVGDLARSVVDAGGRVVVGGLEPLVPHAERVGDYAADDAVATTLDQRLGERGDVVPPTPIRRAAADRSLDEVSALWADEPVADVLGYGEAATHDRGVALVDAGDQFEEAATALVAAGAQVIVHVTADGIPTGHPVAPVVKVTGDPETAAALRRDIDVDASTADGDALLSRVVTTANGEETAAENHGLTAFAIARSGPSL